MDKDRIARSQISNLKSSVNSVFVNVKDFGAKCDGVTDDTVAIQKAIDSISKDANYGGEVIIPGLSVISANPNQLLSLPTGATYGIRLYNNNIILRGTGHHSGFVASTTNPPKYMVVMDSVYAGFGNRGGGICDLKIDGKNLASYGLLIGGNYYSCVVQSFFRNIFITNTRRYGLVLDVTQNNYLELIQVENCGGCICYLNGAGNNYFTKGELNAAGQNAVIDGNGNITNGVSLLPNVCFDMQKIDVDDLIRTTVSSTSASGQSTVNVSSTVGFTIGDSIVIGNIDNEEVVTINTINSNNFIVNKNLSKTHSSSEVVAKINGAITNLSQNSSSGQKILNVNSTSGFKLGNIIVVGSGTSNEEICIVNGINTTNKTITTEGNLTKTHSTNDVIVVAMNTWGYNIFSRIPQANTITGKTVIERGKTPNTVYIRYGNNNIISDCDVETSGNTDCGVRINNNAATYHNKFYDDRFSGNFTSHSTFITSGFRTFIENCTFDNYNNTELQLGNYTIVRYSKTTLGDDPRVSFFAGDPASDVQFNEPESYLSYNNVYDEGAVTTKRHFDINDRHFVKGRNGIQEFNFIDSSKILIMDDFFYQVFPTDTNTPWIRHKGSHASANLPSISSVVENGYLTLVPGSSSGTLASDGSQIVSALPITLQNKGFAVLEAQLKVNSAIDNVSINFGLTDSTDLQEPFTIDASDVLTKNTSNAACFVYDGSSATKEWWTCSVDSGTLDSGSDRVAFLIEPCDTSWTAGNANVTSTLDTSDYRSNGKSVSLAVSSALTNATTTLNANYVSSQKTITVVSVAGFNVGDSIVLGRATDNSETTSISSIDSVNKIITISTVLSKTHSSGDTVDVAKVIGYKTLSSAKFFNMYKGISFWFKSSVALDAGDYQILYSQNDDCSPGTGDFYPEKIELPAISANTWTYVKLKKPTYYVDGLIKSIGIRCVKNKGTHTIKIDDIRNYNIFDSNDNNQNPNDNYAPVLGIDQTLRIEFEPGHTYNKDFISTGFPCDGSSIRFYVNDVLVKVLNNVGISPSVALYPTLVVNSTGAVSGSVSVDYIKMYYSR